MPLNALNWLQESIYFGLQSCALFDPLNIVLEREYLADNEALVDSLWLTPRNGRSGAGCLVEMPRLIVDQPNSQVNGLLGSVVIVEERTLNLTPGTGTAKSSEEWAVLAHEFMREWIISHAGGLVPEPNAIERAKDYSGVIAYRAAIRMRAPRTLVPRCNLPALTNNSGTITLANGADTPTADIYYTTDGNFPGKAEVMARAGKSSTPYTAPFSVDPGTIVQWAAYQESCFPSFIGHQLIN